MTIYSILCNWKQRQDDFSFGMYLGKKKKRHWQKNREEESGAKDPDIQSIVTMRLNFWSHLRKFKKVDNPLNFKQRETREEDNRQHFIAVQTGLGQGDKTLAVQCAFMIYCLMKVLLRYHWKYYECYSCHKQTKKPTLSVLLSSNYSSLIVLKELH